MIPLYTKQEFKLAKSKQKLPIKCKTCNKTFYKTKHEIQRSINPKANSTGDFCSQTCNNIFRNPPIHVKCTQCNKKFQKTKSQIKKSKSGNHFCSRSCSAKWTNVHKKHGTRRSKLEKWIEEQLINVYPKLEIHFNRKDTIESELDIYIPSLNLAFELNGIFHYEPIFGQEKLALIQNNDQRKFQDCIEQNIELCIIDNSALKYFKPKKAQKYLDIIVNVINIKLSMNSSNN